MQIKLGETTSRSLGLLLLKKERHQKVTNIDEDVEKLERLCTVGGRGVKWYSRNGTVWQFFKKLKRELPRVPAILLLGICPRDLKEGSQRDISTPIVIAALFTKAKMWKQLSVHQWITG